MPEDFSSPLSEASISRREAAVKVITDKNRLEAQEAELARWVRDNPRHPDAAARAEQLQAVQKKYAEIVQEIEVLKGNIEREEAADLERRQNLWAKGVPEDRREEAVTLLAQMWHELKSGPAPEDDYSLREDAYQMAFLQYQGGKLPLTAKKEIASVEAKISDIADRLAQHFEDVEAYRKWRADTQAKYVALVDEMRED